MRVSLIRKNNIQGIILPDRVFGSYWITDLDENENERNLISIEAYDGKWRVVSNNNVFCVINDSYVPTIDLQNYSFVSLKSIEYRNGIKTEEKMLLFASPSMEAYASYDISGKISSGISIGKNKSCDIVYDNPSFLEEQAKIEYMNNRYFITSKGFCYLNNKIIVGRSELNDGDVIFLLGLKIILAIKDKYHMLMINNPLDKVFTNLPLVKTSNKFIEKEEIIDDEDVFMSLYNENDYYHKNPRFKSKIDVYEINVDTPPEPNNTKETPFLLTVGPMLMMSMTSMFSAYNAYNALNNGTTTLMNALPSIIMAVSMLSTAIIWPFITKAYNKREKKKYEAERQEKYSNYINEKLNNIQNEIAIQRSKLIDMYPSTEVCQETILKKMTRLWERRIEDEDFLTVNLGLGTKPMYIKINWPSEHFTMAEDGLKKSVSNFINAPKNLYDVPIELSLYKNNKVAIIGKNNITSELMKRLLLQIMAYHSYDDLRIVILTNKENKKTWEFMKISPYIWSNDKSFRYFGENSEEYKEICYNLDAIYNSRENDKENIKYRPYYLIITDSYKSIRNFDFFKKIVKNTTDKGFSFVILNEKITNMPEQFETFVNFQGEHGELVETTANSRPIEFSLSQNTYFDYYKCAKVLANLPVEIVDDKNGELPASIGFLEMYDVGKVEQLNSVNRWESSNPILSLHAPVGVGTNGEKIELDLHEKYHGPHGLIAGMTGSGKSEFILTYILSMAINYHPYEVQFILIDYKGGGLAGALKSSKFRLPHLVGTITNLDANEINRSLASIESELKRRQAAFNKAREISGDSTIDIYKYQKMYRDHIVDEPISHLFIISDEFAELKVQQPDFMQQLIQTARIGRSLGVHLILATQKPSGVVDSQIWSNTRFRVCLRVQEQSDSTEVIKRQDAAYIKQTGRFYFQVGYNEIFVLGQAAWAGKKYIPSNHISRNIDSDVNFINNIGYVIKTTSTTKKNINVKSYGEEITNIVRYLSDIAKEFNIKKTQLWLDRIPNEIYVNDLIQKYNIKKGNYIINPIIGEYDDPSRQLQNILTLPLTQSGNALIYGIAGSGKENFISTLIYSSMLMYTPDDLNIYVIDCGTGFLKSYKDFPIVGDIISSDNDEKIQNTFKLINTYVEERKKLFANYNGDYVTYCKLSNKKLPAIVVVLNEYEAFKELYEDYDDILIDLTRDAYKYGIYFVITASTPNAIRFKLKQNFGQVFALQQNNDDDFNTILGNVRKHYPSKNYGRGIIKFDNVYEFQTAMPCNRDNIQSFITNIAKEYSKKYPNKVLAIPTLPEKVSYKDIAQSFGKNENLIVGISKENLAISEFNYRKNLMNLVLAQDIQQTFILIKPFISELLCLKEIITLFNADIYELDDIYKKYMIYNDSSFDEGIQNLFDFVDNAYKKYVQNNYKVEVLKDIKHRTLIIVGIDNFFSRISNDSKSKFEKLIEEAKNLNILNIIVFENSNGIHRYEIESWFKNSVNMNEGIWIGNGFNDQYTLKTMKRTNDMKLDIQDNYGFVVRRGKATLIKLLEIFDLKFK